MITEEERSKLTPAENKANIKKAIDSWSRHFPPSAPLTDAQKKARLAEIKIEINQGYRQIGQQHQAATKLMHQAVQHAKRVGDLLLEVKWNLLDHGEYEDWLDKHFLGGSATARAYTRIAKFTNWKKIVHELGELGDMTIERALGLIRARGPEEEPKDKHWLYLMKYLVSRLRMRAACWPEHVIRRLAYDDEIINRFEEAAKIRNKAIVAAMRANAAAAQKGYSPYRRRLPAR